MFDFRAVYANDIEAFIPELWANESLAILEENMIVGNLIHRDFSNEIKNKGDVVHTRRPAEFVAKRKSTNDNVTIQDATATDVQVPLNQHVHVSFLIRDGEESKSFKDLVDTYLRPAILAQARFIDQMLLGQVYQFLANVYGGLGTMTSSNAVDYLTGVRNKMNINKAYMMDRNLILTPSSETTLLKLDAFTSADKVGDDGTALREASLGRKYGFNLYMCQNTSSVSTGNTTTTGAIDNASGYAAGTTTVTVDGFSAAISAGTWITIAGDDQPLRVASTVGGATPTSITFSPALKAAVVDNAVVTTYTPGAVNQSVSPTGYAINWEKEIVVDGFTVAPQVGQLVAFGTAADVYSIVGVPTTTSIMLDRPLAAAIADDAKVNIGPRGDYNFAFHRNALALVIRPLAMPRAGLAVSAAVDANGLAMRSTITYNGDKQGHLVTLDFLCGVAILDTDLGAVLLA